MWCETKDIYGLTGKDYYSLQYNAIVNGMMCSSHFCPCHFKDSAAIRSKYPTNASLAVFNRTWGDNAIYTFTENPTVLKKIGTKGSSY